MHTSTSPTEKREIARLTKQFYELDGISAVRSIAEPTGETPGYFQPFRSSGLKKLAARRAQDHEVPVFDASARA